MILILLINRRVEIMDTPSLGALKPLMILVIGLPGSGKSFFARQFAERYKFFYVDSGRYETELEALSLDVKMINTLAKKLAGATFEEALKSFKHIVLEGSFSSAKEREEILQKADKAGFGTLVVWVQTDIETAAERAINRDRRRQDDKYSINISEEEFKNQVKVFEKPNPAKEILVVISGKHDFRSQSLIVLKKIAGIYVNNVVGDGSGSLDKSKKIIR